MNKFNNIRSLISFLSILFALCLCALTIFGCAGADGVMSDGSVGDDIYQPLPDEPSDGSVGDDIYQPLPDEPSDGGQTDGAEEEEAMKISITVGGNTAEIALEENGAAHALAERLMQGDVSYTAEDYGGFEKVGYLGFSLPRADERITTQSGDVVLYQGNQIVLFYGSNTWAYTRLGKIEGLSQGGLEELLCAGKGSVSVTLSLAG